jgi:deazaflavin-dependent oxidoreductase (nitroreductase family)
VLRAVRAMVAAAMRSPFRHVVRPLVTPLDRFLFRLTGGRWKLSAALVPSLTLYSTGAKTGLRRESPLMCFPQPDGSWYVVGSNFGLERHPAWSANLIAHPEAQVHYRRELVDVTGRLLDAAEAEATWPVLERQWPRYRDSRRRRAAPSASSTSCVPGAEVGPRARADGRMSGCPAPSLSPTRPRPTASSPPR